VVDEVVPLEAEEVLLLVVVPEEVLVEASDSGLVVCDLCTAPFRRFLI